MMHLKIKPDGFHSIKSILINPLQFKFKLHNQYSKHKHECEVCQKHI